MTDFAMPRSAGVPQGRHLMLNVVERIQAHSISDHSSPPVDISERTSLISYCVERPTPRIVLGVILRVEEVGVPNSERTPIQSRESHGHGVGE